MPETVAYILYTISGIIGTTATVFLANVAIAYAISAAATAVFGPKPPQGVLRDRTVTVREPTAARRIIYGQARVGGVIVFVDVTDNNKHLHLVVAFAAHEVESFDKFYFNEDELTIVNNKVTAPAQYVDAGGNSRAEIYTMTGTDSQSACSTLVGRSTLWTSAHRMRGIAYAYIRLYYDPAGFPSGLPNITALISGKKVYDPRTGLTAYSNNAALCTADYLMDSRYGLGVPLANIDTTVLTTAADTCDESVTLAAATSPISTESRYTCNGVLDMDATPREIIEALNTAKAAATVYNIGKWYVHAGAYKTPTLTLDDDDFAGPMQVSTKLPRSELYNSVKGVYAAPDNNWQLSDFPVVSGSTYISEDNGDTIWRDIQLPFTTSPARAQRIALLELNRARRQISVNAPFKLKALDVVPSDVIQLTNTRMGWDKKTFEAMGWRFIVGDDSSLSVALTLRETDSSVYTWTTANESAANAAPTTNLPNYSTVAAPTGLSVTSFQVPTGAGTDETFKVLLEWTSPADEFVVNGGFIEIQYKLTSDSTWRPSWLVDGSLTYSEIPMLSKGVSYDVRIRSYNGLAKSDWVQIAGFTVLGSGSVGTTQDWGDWTSDPFATSPGVYQNWGDWTSDPHAVSPATIQDWENWA